MLPFTGILNPNGLGVAPFCEGVEVGAPKLNENCGLPSCLSDAAELPNNGLGASPFCFAETPKGAGEGMVDLENPEDVVPNGDDIEELGAAPKGEGADVFPNGDAAGCDVPNLKVLKPLAAGAAVVPVEFIEVPLVLLLKPLVAACAAAAVVPKENLGVDVVVLAAGVEIPVIADEFEVEMEPIPKGEDEDIDVGAATATGAGLGEGDDATGLATFPKLNFGAAEADAEACCSAGLLNDVD